MEAMFYSAIAFNQDISGWDVSNDKSMSYMFRSAESFDQDISTWNTGSVTSFHSMFRSALNFNHDLSAWDISEAASMSYMFYDAVSFEQVLCWALPDTTYDNSMFDGSGGTIAADNDNCEYGGGRAVE